MGLLGTKTLVSPISLIIGKSLHSVSLTFLEFQWKDSGNCKLGEGGDAETRKANNQEKQQ